MRRADPLLVSQRIRLVGFYELGQRVASLAVAIRRATQPVVRALDVAMLAQQDAEIALGRWVVCLGRAVEPFDSALGVAALAPEQQSERVCALGVIGGAAQPFLGGVEIAALPEQHAEPVRGVDVTGVRGLPQVAFGRGAVGVAEPLPERERGGAVSGVGGRTKIGAGAAGRVGLTRAFSGSRGRSPSLAVTGPNSPGP